MLYTNPLQTPETARTMLHYLYLLITVTALRTTVHAHFDNESVFVSLELRALAKESGRTFDYYARLSDLVEDQPEYT